MLNGIHTGLGAGGWLLMSLLWIALMATVVWAIARIAPSRGREADDERHTPSQEEPLKLLDRRLASGEIDVETYDQLKSKLTSRPAAGMG